MADVQILKYCVDNEWRESTTDKYMDVTDSSTGEVFAKAPCCTAAEVTAAIESANAAFPAWSGMPAQKRTQVLYRWKTILEQHEDELAYMCSRELGKNLDEARGEIVKIIEGCEVGVTVPMTAKGESLMNVSTGHDTVSYREPLGVFAGIAPFNFPAMIPFGWMIPLAIATGNTFVLKAASLVPTTGIRLLETLIEAGLPKGVVNLVTCSRNEAEIMMTHPAIRGVSFVGSTSVGKHVYSIAAAHGKRVQAQTEAKNHGLVLEDASLERAAAGIINSTFGCAGMRCMALPVCVVQNSVADEFIGYMKKFAQERVVGCSYDPKTELGPVVSAEHQKFVKDWITKGVEERVADNFRDRSWDYHLRFNVYGRDGVMADLEPTPSTSGVHELGIVIEATAETQEQADTICAFARSTMLHYGYTGRRATAGNLAFPYSPSDCHIGAVYVFSVYHLLAVDDPAAHFPIEIVEL